MPVDFSSSSLQSKLNAIDPDSVETLALILGDQLNAKHSWFKQVRENRLLVFIEHYQEATYVRHHIQKVVGFFAAMRQFASALHQSGHRVLYLPLDKSQAHESFSDTLGEVVKHCQPQQLHLQYPDEYRLQQELDDFTTHLDCEDYWFDTEHFMTPRTVLTDWFGDQNNYLMENFYRRIRRETGLLMDGDKPVGGQWNYDKQNRKSLPKEIDVPAPILFSHDVSELVELVQDCDIETLGTIDANNFIWPINRQQSRQVLAYFCEHFLPHFGDYQDAMSTDQWSLYHARISFSLNTKMLSPRGVVDYCLDYWQHHQDEISLNQIEGFIRQIIGWREFIRAMYWRFMPNFAEQNYFDHQAPLPDFYWTGKTSMNCLHHAITNSLDHAYAHHIQRLMVTGNFALLAGVDPASVDAWYLGIYCDAIEWVELPNTRGMSQFADGGRLASKPYVSSGTYINKMSNYCTACHYDVKEKFGDKACPFNSLYWNFIDQHEAKLSKNGRMGLILAQWRKQDSHYKQQIREQAAKVLQQISAKESSS